MKCARETCTRNGYSRQQGLCHQHYRISEHGFVDGEPVRAHLENLRRFYSLRTTAKLAGMTPGGLLYITGQGEWVQRKTARIILAIRVPARPSDVLVDSTGTVRRVRALVAIGWPQTHIAERAGLTSRRLSQLMRQPMIHARNANLVTDTFNALHMTPGPCGPIRKTAQRRGWVPPLAWDEDTIDDPNATPDLGGKSTWMQIYEDHQWVHGDDNKIAEAMGIQLESVKRQLERKGEAA
ncbi:hypothetical protein [Mycobacteroides chelonae]|uniref:hypothetical protein n=1 Tax=Mycobacteroides chelonae TaxID=1774 RepID=UPI0009C14F0C|nr:hypothetical protein [Mycobacteroides chelonae]MBF9523073.1 DNA-binding protein [Mycobacteroides chelonae]MBF9523077.1 DNA-binding protein [Mycobacteroides chelonae]